MVQTPHCCDQGRARGLYDEQLQRQEQEKRLAKGAASETAAAILGGSPRLPAPSKVRRQAFFRSDHVRGQDDIDFVSDL